MYLRKYQKVFILALFAFCVSFRLCYAGQEVLSEPETMGDEMLLQEIPSAFDASKYDQPFSSASKNEQKVTEAPSSVSVITADEIKKYGYRNFAEILQSIRGFQTTYDRNYHYVGVRGFGIPGDFNTRILVLIDGHRINDNIQGQVLIGTAFPLDIDLIDRIEVVRGPGSSLYGSNAFFAVINVITRRGRDLKGFETSGEAGSFESYKTRFSYGNRFQNGLEMILSGSHYDSEGHDRLFFREFDSPDTNNGIAEDRDYNRFNSFFGAFSFHDFTLQGDYHSDKKGVPTASYETVFNENEFTIDDTSWVDLKYEHVYGDQLDVLARISYNNYHLQGDYPNKWDPPYPPVVVNRDKFTGRWVRGEVQFSKTFMEVHKGTVGLEYQYNLQQDQLNYDVDIAGSINLDDRRNSQQWAVFLQDEFPIIDKLTFNLGVRLDYYDTFGGSINPRSALIYNPFEQTTFKMVYGRAFRAPTEYELYYNDGYVTQKPNPDLKPETIDTYELIYEQYMGKHYRGTIVGFYNSIHDLIALKTDTADLLTVYDNLNNVRAMGMEFEMEGKWTGGHEGRVSYTFQETENKETGKTVVNSPENMVKLNFIGALLKEKIFLGMEEQYTSRRKTISDNFADDFFITNLTLLGRNIFKTLEISGSVYNLFDKTYADRVSDAHIQDTIRQDGRTFRIKLTYAF